MITEKMSFKDFIGGLIVENLHPELRDVIQSDRPSSYKHTATVRKIKDLTTRGEPTGIEGNMPKGSSRAYMKHRETHKTTVDGKPAEFAIGTKVAIKSPLDRHHQPGIYDDMNLGQLQNHAENGDEYVNKSYRILTKNHEKEGYHTNHEHGILPPLVDHDEKSHHWGIVGHARNLEKGEFRKLTKHPDYPKGISHKDFYSALVRGHEQAHGNYWRGSETHEANMKYLNKHPLVQKFLDHQDNTGMPPHDLGKRNMGVFEHPDGSKHIVARDTGFSTRVQHAYKNARVNQALGDRRAAGGRLSAMFRE